MQIVGIIPARYQSTRFPAKPLAMIHGRPMIQHVYERSRLASRLDRLLVATDDTCILEAVEAFGGEALLTGSHHPSGTDRVAEACRLLNLSDGDIVVNIQGDEPLVEPVMIHLLIEALEKTPRCPMATLGFQTSDERDYLNPNVVKLVMDNSGRALYFSRSPLPCRRDAGDAPLSFIKHLGFYAYRNAFLQTFTELSPGRLENIEKLEQLRTLEHGYCIRVALSPVETHGIDTPQDLEKLNLIMHP
ncbi:MAG: 3-deoxy-manno-octulosonate cytidylyltransferase [Deltaproteobacteria bacterium]|nr:3-deoxy-manno-octulosonate cytidylyltransferase [Deltaproteobacteria bacterium]